MPGSVTGARDRFTLRAEPSRSGDDDLGNDFDRSLRLRAVIGLVDLREDLRVVGAGPQRVALPQLRVPEDLDGPLHGFGLGRGEFGHGRVALQILADPGRVDEE